MKRRAVFLDERLEHQLGLIAREQGRPLSALVLEALKDYVVAQRPKRRGVLSFLAIGRSRRRQTAARHERLLFAKL